MFTDEGALRVSLRFSAFILVVFEGFYTPTMFGNSKDTRWSVGAKSARWTVSVVSKLLLYN